MALFLAFALVFGTLVPVVAWAEEPANVEEPTVESEPDAPLEKETQAESEEQLPEKELEGKEEVSQEVEPEKEEQLDLDEEHAQEAVGAGPSLELQNLVIIAKDKDGECYGIPAYRNYRDTSLTKKFIPITKKQYDEASKEFVLNFKREGQKPFVFPLAEIEGKGQAGEVFTEIEFKHHTVANHVFSDCKLGRKPEDDAINVLWLLTLKQDYKIEAAKDYGAGSSDPGNFFIHLHCILDGQGHTISRVEENKLGDIVNEILNISCIYKAPQYSEPKNTVTLRNLTIDGSEKYRGIQVNSNTNLVLDGGVIIQNCKTLTGHSGSAIGYEDQGSSLKMHGAGNVVRNCISEEYCGGSICFASTVTADIDGARFENNEAKLGGAISSLEADSKITIQNTTFENNKATEENGGAIYSQSPLEIKNSIFKSNIAKESGGGIMTCNNSTLNIVGGRFEENQANGSGGAIYIPENKLTVQGTKFQGNQAKWGGGIMTYGELDMTGGSFEKNHATKDGGAIYVGEKSATLKGTTFKENTAVEKGGALYVDGLVTDDNDVKSVNADLKVTIAEKTKFESNTAGQEGGAIYTIPYQYQDTIDKNHTGEPAAEQKPYENLDIDNTTLFKENKADGGLFVPPSNFADFTNLSFAKESDVTHEKLKVKSLLNNYDVNYKGEEPTEPAEPSEPPTPPTPSRDERIIVDPNGGTFSDGTTGRKTYDLKAGETFVLPAAPTREGYKFIAWEGKSGTYQPGDKYTVKSGGDVFTARWEEEKKPEEKPSVTPNIKTPRGTPLTPDEIAKILQGMKKTVPAIPRAGVGK